VLEAHHPEIEALSAELLTLALDCQSVAFIAVAYMLREAARDTEIHPTLRRLRVERSRYWLERIVALAVARGASEDEDHQEGLEQLPLLDPATRWPLASLEIEQPEPEDPSKPSASFSLRPRSRTEPPAGQVFIRGHYLEAAALTHLAQRLQGRAQVLGKSVEILTQPLARPLLVGEDRALVFSMLGLESIADTICCALIDHCRLAAHHWPGNVRELRNVIERCVLFADTEAFPAEWLQLGEPQPADAAQAIESAGNRLILPLDGSISLEEMERYILQKALEQHQYNISATARALGATRETLRYRVDKYDLLPRG
jgi:hypothetical protein